MRARLPGWIRLLAPALITVVVAAVLRIYDLELKPLHHDEGVNGYFLLKLIRERTYVYDPANYHGPTLYYFAILTSSYLNLIFGETAINTTALRLVPAFFGVATVWLLSRLRRWTSNLAAVTAALLLAVSPGAVYFSRYFIHETVLLFFTLALIVTATRVYRNPGIGTAVWAAAAAGFLVATKETAVITLGVLALAVICTRIYMRAMTKWLHLPAEANNSAPPALERRTVAAILLSGTAVFVLLFVTLYSTFFFNFPKGVHDALISLAIWSQTATAAHTQPWYTYFNWLLAGDPVLLFAAAGGAILCLWRGTSFAVFCSLWAWGMVAAYSLIPYKAPWLALNFLVPFAIVAGLGLDIALRAAADKRQRTAIGVVGLMALIVSLWQAVELNFFRYDDETGPYVYAHTKREFAGLIDAIDEYARETGTGNRTTIWVVSYEYWPLPWYLRGYPNAWYPGRVDPTDAALIVAADTQEQEVMRKFGARYRLSGSYPLRAGMNLLLYVRTH